MSKSVKIWVVFCFLSIGAIAQPSVESGMSYNSYDMSDFKKINYVISRQLPFTPQVVQNFPSYFGYYIQVNISENKGKEFVSNGVILFDYMSTGSRIGLNDFSGYFSFDQLVSRFAIGMGKRWEQKKRRARYKFGFEVLFKIHFSKLTVDSSFDLYNSNYNLDFDEIENSISNTIGGAIHVSFLNNYYLSKKIYLSNKIGFGLEAISYNINTYEDNSALAPFSNGEEIKVDWTGFRFSLGIGIKLN